MPISIRPEKATDIAAIHSLTREAFRSVAHSSHREQFINDALREAGQLVLSLVAIDGGEMVGHVAVSPVALSGDTCGWFGLGPVAVLPERQREGIGSMLIGLALDDLRQQGANGCVVLGDPGYYRRFGFDTNPLLVLPDVPPQYFQVLSFGAPVPSAIVAYHESFNAQAEP